MTVKSPLYLVFFFFLYQDDNTLLYTLFSLTMYVMFD